MIKWFAKIVLGIIKEDCDLMRKWKEEVRDVASASLADVLRSVFISDHALSDAHRKYYEAWDVSRISRALKEGVHSDLNTLVLNAIAKQNEIMLAAINSEEFIDKIVERINRKQVGK